MASLRLVGQAAAFTLFAVVVVYFSAAPAYQHLKPGEALIRLSLTHEAKLLGECRTLTAAELARLAPNMRRPEICPRERAPVRIRIEIDHMPVYEATIPPRGIARDGPAVAYQRFVVPAGSHRLRVLLGEGAQTTGYDSELVRTLELAPRQILTIDFDPARGGVVFS